MILSLKAARSRGFINLMTPRRAEWFNTENTENTKTQSNAMRRRRARFRQFFFSTKTLTETDDSTAMTFSRWKQPFLIIL